MGPYVRIIWRFFNVYTGSTSELKYKNPECIFQNFQGDSDTAQPSVGNPNLNYYAGDSHF